jgi:hypothetical protein
VLLDELLGRATCGLVVLLDELLGRATCGLDVLLDELLGRVTCDVAEWLTAGAVVLLERETAAVWLLLVVLPPCERLRPWAEASDAPMIRHPMSAKLIIIFVTEVFIIVLF